MMQGAVLARVGRLDEAVAAWQAARPYSVAAHDYDILAIILGNLAEIAVERGDLVEADQLLARALECANQVGDPHLIGIYQKTVADVAFVRGHWRQARDALQGVQGAPDLVTQLVRASLGRLDLAEGRTEQGIAALEAVAAQNSVPQGLNVSIDATVFARQTLAECALLAGRAVDAHAWLEACADDEEIFHARASIVLAWAHADLGDMEQAEAVVAESLTRATARQQRCVLVDALRIKALLTMRKGRWHEAVELLEETLALCRAMSYPYAEAKALYVYGQLYVAKGEPGLARERYTQALAICARLGERLYRPHVECALAALEREFDRR